MTDRVRAGYPIKIPPFKWDGTEQEWEGRLINADDTDLPIAYLYERIITGLINGVADAHFVGKNASRPGRPLRVPCVLMGGDSTLISGASQDIRDRADAIGLIHMSVPPIPYEDGTPLGTISIGMPISDYDGGNPQTTLEPEWFLGGRLGIIHDGPDWTDYFPFIDQGIETATAQPGTEEFCSGQGDNFDAGEGTAEYDAYGTPGTKTSNTDLYNADLAYFFARATRFDKVKVWIRRPTAETVYYNIGVTCHELNEDIDVVITTDEQEEAVSWQQYYTDIRASADQVAGDLSSYAEVSDSTPTAEQILTFFESES